jgi:hypothetical protein
VHRDALQADQRFLMPETDTPASYGVRTNPLTEAPTQQQQRHSDLETKSQMIFQRHRRGHLALSIRGGAPTRLPVALALAVAATHAGARDGLDRLGAVRARYRPAHVAEGARVPISAALRRVEEDADGVAAAAAPADGQTAQQGHAHGAPLSNPRPEPRLIMELHETPRAE